MPPVSTTDMAVDSDAASPSPPGSLMTLLEEADALQATDPAKAEARYHAILDAPSTPAPTDTLPATATTTTTTSVAAAGIAFEEEENRVKVKEGAIAGLAEVFVKRGDAAAIADLGKKLRVSFFTTIAKAKTAKIVRSLIDAVARIPGTLESGVQVQMCEETVVWCKEERRTFLRQRIEARLAALRLDAKRYTDAMTIITSLLREVKRMDDKAHLLEIQLLESRVYHALRNLPKSRAALTSARTTANAIYVPPALQGEIDMQAGIVAAEEKDYKTAYSYFYEAFEGFSSLEDPRAVRNLKYMLLCKIMTNNAPDIATIMTGSVALKYSGPEVDAMKAVGAAYEARLLQNFEDALDEHKPHLSDDPVVHAHLSTLYDALLEGNLSRIIEPFSKVEIAHVAKLIKLPLETVEAKLSQMILDKKLNGILDQGKGCLIVFEDLPVSTTYQATLDTLHDVDTVLDSLFQRANTLRR